MPTSNLIETIDAITNAETADCDLKRENGNINGDSAMGIMLRYGSEVSKDYVLRNVIPENISKAHDEGYIHIHDLDFYLLTTTCRRCDTLRFTEVTMPCVKAPCEELVQVYLAASGSQQVEVEVVYMDIPLVVCL